MLTGGSAVENIRRGLIRFIGPAIMVTEIALVAALAFLIAKIAWLVIEPGGAVSGTEPLAQNARVEAERVNRDLVGDMTLLVTSDPFSRSADPVADIPVAPETKLNWS